MTELTILIICAVLSVAACVYQLRHPAENHPRATDAEPWWWNIPM